MFANGGFEELVKMSTSNVDKPSMNADLTKEEEAVLNFKARRPDEEALLKEAQDTKSIKKEPENMQIVRDIIVPKKTRIQPNVLSTKIDAAH